MTRAAGAGAGAAGTWALARRFVALIDARLTMAAFVVLTIVGSLAEAVVILLVVSGASGLAEQRAEIVVDVGPVVESFALGTVLWLSVAGTVLLVGSRLAAGALSAQLGGRLLHAGRDRLVRGLLSAAWANQSMVTAARLQDLLSVQSLRMADLAVLLSNFLAATLSFLAMVAAALLVDPVTALVLLVMGVALGGVFRPLTRHVRRRSSDHLHQHHGYIGFVANLFGVLPEIRIYRVGGAVTEEHDRTSRNLADAYRRMRFAATVQPSVYLGVVMLLLVVGLGAVSTRGTLDVALVGAIVLVLLRGLRYSQQAQSRWQSAVELLPYVGDFERIIQGWKGAERTWGSRPLDRAGRLELQGVEYVYPSGDVGLREVDLVLEPGRIVGLAGPSGAGKSTLAQILLGLREPTSGAYLVDGVPSSTFDEDSWFSRFAYVAQQPILLEGDVRSNVRFFRDTCADEAVDEALSAAAMDTDLGTWTDGSGRQVGAAGSEVSGGQRQRIAIARALVGHPDVLVLDEPTSALDPDAERAIRDTLERLRDRLTVILIAHRESTLQVCDVVVTLDGGRVVSVAERAAHEH